MSSYARLGGASQTTDSQTPAGKGPAENVTLREHTLVVEPVIVKQVQVFSFSLHNRNEYFAKGEDGFPGEPVKDPSPLQRGHVYVVALSTDPTLPKTSLWWDVQCPHRICDEETAALLEGLEFRNADPELIKRNRAKKAEDRWNVDVTQALMHRFVLTDDAVGLFRQRVEALGGRIDTPLVNGELARVLLTELREMHGLFREVTLPLIAAVNQVSGLALDVAEEVLRRIDDVEELQRNVFELQSQIAAVNAEALRGRPTPSEHVMIQAANESGRVLTEEVSQFRPADLRKLITARIQVPTEAPTPYALTHVLTLLSRSYPIFGRMQVDDEGLAIRLGPATLHLHAGGARLVGDVASAFEQLTGAGLVIMDRPSVTAGDNRFDGV